MSLSRFTATAWFAFVVMVGVGMAWWRFAPVFESRLVDTVGSWIVFAVVGVFTFVFVSRIWSTIHVRRVGVDHGVEAVDFGLVEVEPSTASPP